MSLAKPFNVDNDGVSCRTLKYQYQQTSAANLMRTGSFGATGVIVRGLNLDSDGESVRGLKAQYQKNSASNFCRDGSYGASAVVVIDEQNKNFRQDGTVGTLTTDGSSPKHNNRIGEIRGDNLLRIRKLTPKECWRLQGWKDEDFEKAKSVCSDSQLYKQAG